jgi:RNA polymerase sigma factor (sigma-70 family)
MAELPPPFDDKSFLEHARFVRALAGALARDRDQAEEVAARTFASAVEQRPRAGATLRGWLASVVRRALARLRRDEVRRVARESAAARPEQVDADPADLAARSELSDRIAVAFAQLEEPVKTTLFLRFFADLTPKQIAAKQQVPVETVKTRLKRGLQRLRERLDANADRRGAARGDWRAVALVLAKQGGPVAAIAKAKGLAAAAIVVALVGIVALKFAPRNTSASASPAVASSNAQEGAERPLDADAHDEPVVAGSREPSRVAEPPPIPFASGQVVDEDGRPIAGVRVVASVLQRMTSPFQNLASSTRLDQGEIEQRTVARSGAEGRFVVAPAPEDVVGFYFVAVDHVLASWFDLSADPAENQDHRIELASACVLRGRVLDQEGRPIFDAAVGASDPLQEVETRTARNLEGAPSYRRILPSLASTRCSKVDGRFELRSLPRTSIRIGAGATGYVPFAEDHEGGGRDWEIRLWRNRPIVDVTDARTGAPIATARAFLGRADEPGYRALLSPTVFLESGPRAFPPRTIVLESARAGANQGDSTAPARFLVSPLDLLFDDKRPPCATARLLVFAEGYRPRTVEVAVNLDGQPPHVAVDLKAENAEPSISGTIRGAAHARVDVHWTSSIENDPANEIEVAKADVDRDGRFVIRGLPELSYRLVVRAHGCAPRCLTVQAPARDLDLALAPCASLEVVAIDASGAPRPGAAVHVQTRDRRWAWSTKSDAQGVARFPELPDGDLRIVAATDLDNDDTAAGARAFPDFDFDPDDDLTLAAGERRRVERRIVEPVDVTFHVRGVGNHPVEGAGIQLALAGIHAPTRSAREILRTVHWLVLETDCDGDAHVQLLPSTCTLDVQFEGGRFQSKVKIPKQAAARFELPGRDG